MNPTTQRAHPIITRSMSQQQRERDEQNRAEVKSWEKARNQIEAKMDWQFTTADAQIKLKELYPTISVN